LQDPADAHLSADEIIDLVDNGIDALERMEMIEAHLQLCEFCRSRIAAVRKRDDQLRHLPEGRLTSSGPDCPTSEAWLELACGLLPDEEVERLLSHASSCDQCGRRLSHALVIADHRATPGEEQVLRNFEWGRDRSSSFATKLKRQSGGLPNWNELKIWAVAAGVIIAAAAGAWLVQGSRKSSPDQLIAQAYTEERTLALRIEGASYGPMKQRRGPGQSKVNRPYSLVKAESDVSRELLLHPDSVQLLQARGRIDLLDWDCADAISVFKNALRERSVVSSLQTDLASAYFECAEVQSQDSDYGLALNLLSQVLRKNPQDSIALFNRAIVYERMGQPHEAIADWERYVRLDPKSIWAVEARDALQRLTAR